MHAFQPFPIEELEFNPFEKIGKEWALVSAGSKQKANTMTVSWGGVGVLWGKEFIDSGDFFSVSFMSESYKKALNYCGSHSGKNKDKMAGAGLTWNYKHSIPFIDEGSFILLCQKMSATKITEASFLSPDIKKWYTDGDLHTMYVGEIIEVLAR